MLNIKDIFDMECSSRCVHFTMLRPKNNSCNQFASVAVNWRQKFVKAILPLNFIVLPDIPRNSCQNVAESLFKAPSKYNSKNNLI